jgi:glycine/D-amino acid oxidase-like deaminating enzyme
LAVQTAKSVKVKTFSGEEDVPADIVVLAAGPWTGELAMKMLGNKIGGKLGVSGSRAHSIVLKTKEDLSAHCLFTSMSMEDGSVGEPEVYARPDGRWVLFSQIDRADRQVPRICMLPLYISLRRTLTSSCGAGDEEPLPPSADLVKPSPKAIAKLQHQARNLSPVFEPENAETQAEQACFLPMADRGRPFVGKVQGVEGVYIGSG